MTIDADKMQGVAETLNQKVNAQYHPAIEEITRLITVQLNNIWHDEIYDRLKNEFTTKSLVDLQELEKSILNLSGEIEADMNEFEGRISKL